MALLVSLILIAVAEIIFRAVCLGKETLSTPNLGEQIAVLAFASVLLVLLATGKERACFLCYAAWIGYFVLDLVFELPGTVILFITNVLESNIPLVEGLVPFFQLISMLGVIGLGVLLVEYLNDGTIYNGAFNVISLITVSLISISIIGYTVLIFASPIINELFSSTGLELGLRPEQIALAVFNGAYRLTMVFMFTFFAYDSAKHQLKKTFPEEEK